MKIIIAAFDAKRAPFVCATLVALAASVTFIPQAFATGTLWSSPKNDFVLSVPDGWRRDPPPSNLESALLAISTGPPETFRACAVTGEWRSIPSTASQEQGNAALERGADAMMSAFPTLGRRLISYSEDLQSGVQIASIVFEYQQPPTNQYIRSYGRQFILIQDGEFRFYMMHCGVALPATEAEFASVQSFMSSLSFSSAQTQ